jgi:glycerol-3-phosphate acyltransferase PlsY
MNLYRVAGRRYAARAGALDIMKGALPVIAALLFGLSPWVAILGGCAAVAGHIYSPFLRFSGGKGMAASTGILLVLCPALVLVAALPAGLAYKYWLRWVPGSVVIFLVSFFGLALVTAQPLHVVTAPVLVALLGVAAWLPEIIRDRKRAMPPALRGDGSTF